MDVGDHPIQTVTFGPWRFDRRTAQLFRTDGSGSWVAAPLGSRAGNVLGALLREPGSILSKDALMEAVWPGVTVEGNNLTVQIAALRRVLDDGAAGPSLIQTLPGRGYRFVGEVALEGAQRSPVVVRGAPPPGRPRPKIRRAWGAALGSLALGLLLLAWEHRPGQPARGSVIVLPFENLSGDPGEDYLSAAVTDDLTSDISADWSGPVVNVTAARSLKAGTPADEIGRLFGVRYLVRGSIRKLDSNLRVNAQLISTETGAAVWTDRFDVSATDLGAGQEQAVGRIGFGVFRAMVGTEAERSRRERPDNPDSIDLLMQGRALGFQPPSPERLARMRELYERALQRSPGLEVARIQLVSLLLDDEEQNPHGRKAVLERTRALLARIQASLPASPVAMQVQLRWWTWQTNHCTETVDLAQRLIAAWPRIPQAYRWLADCEARLGRAEAAIPVLERLFKLAPEDPWGSHNERNMQFALLLLGRDAESIVWGKRALVDNPDDAAFERGRVKRRLAAAYALSGHLDEARREMADAIRLWPRATAREAESGSQASQVFAAQMARVRRGLALAGLRDHADEDADFGTPSDDRIHQDLRGLTPLTAPGAATIRTDALTALLATEQPIVIDTLFNSAGRSLVGASASTTSARAVP